MESTGLVDGYVLHELLRAAGEDGRAAGPSESGSPAKEYVLEIQGRHNSSGAYIFSLLVTDLCNQAWSGEMEAQDLEQWCSDRGPTPSPLSQLYSWLEQALRGGAGRLHCASQPGHPFGAGSQGGSWDGGSAPAAQPAHVMAELKLEGGGGRGIMLRLPPFGSLKPHNTLLRKRDYMGIAKNLLASHQQLQAALRQAHAERDEARRVAEAQRAAFTEADARKSKDMHLLIERVSAIDGGKQVRRMQEAVAQGSSSWQQPFPWQQPQGQGQQATQGQGQTLYGLSQQPLQTLLLPSAAAGTTTTGRAGSHPLELGATQLVLPLTQLVQESVPDGTLGTGPVAAGAAVGVGSFAGGVGVKLEEGVAAGPGQLGLSQAPPGLGAATSAPGMVAAVGAATVKEEGALAQPAGVVATRSAVPAADEAAGMAAAAGDSRKRPRLLSALLGGGEEDHEAGAHLQAAAQRELVVKQEEVQDARLGLESAATQQGLGQQVSGSAAGARGALSQGPLTQAHGGAGGPGGSEGEESDDDADAVGNPRKKAAPVRGRGLRPVPRGRR